MTTFAAIIVAVTGGMGIGFGVAVMAAARAQQDNCADCALARARTEGDELAEHAEAQPARSDIIPLHAAR